jgi:hypothetical protein
MSYITVVKAISEINLAALKMQDASSRYLQIVGTYLKGTALHHIPEDYY